MIVTAKVLDILPVRIYRKHYHYLYHSQSNIDISLCLVAHRLLFRWLVKCDCHYQTKHDSQSPQQHDKSVDYCIHTKIILQYILLCNTKNNIQLPLHHARTECNAVGLFLLVNRSLSLLAFEKNLCHSVQ